MTFFVLIRVSSAFVGLALLVALLPVPSYLTRLLQGVQTEKMKKVQKNRDFNSPNQSLTHPFSTDG